MSAGRGGQADDGIITHGALDDVTVHSYVTGSVNHPGIEPSTGSVGDSCDNALAETINGLLKAEVIHRRGPRRSFEAGEFATPLDERAVAALAQSATALDAYAWLAQRLHRVPTGRPQFVPWTASHEQFGQGFARLRVLREHFLD